MTFVLGDVEKPQLYEEPLVGFITSVLKEPGATLLPGKQPSASPGA